MNNLCAHPLRLAPQSCTLVIFGATGDLTHRKLIPALYNLSVEGALPINFKVVGFARRKKTDQEFRDELEISIKKYSRTPVGDKIWDHFEASVSYHQSEFDSPEGYIELIKKLQELESISGASSNRLFYLAVAPDQFEVILRHLKESGLNQPHQAGWTRIIIEKPFGVDLKTARHLNDLVHDSFSEESIYRIDHYLGKETAQNIMAFRFANSIFESIWNAKHIHHVQITAAESLGVEGRAGFYDKAGALRDMVQNHLLQLLTLTAMEPPMSMSANAIRDEKVKVLRSIHPLRGKEVFKHVIRAQYEPGVIEGKPLPGYRQEQGVAPDSETETYVALQVAIDNWRWSGVPFFIRAGKRMPHAKTEIVITFNAVPPILFNAVGSTIDQNVLVIRIQPDEGITLKVSAKRPGSSLKIESVKMDFHYGTSFGKANPEAYERLLLDAMSGDATLFARSDEVEEAWTFIDGIQEAWQQSNQDLAFYSSGSHGPEAADELLRRHNATWRQL